MEINSSYNLCNEINYFPDPQFMNCEEIVNNIIEEIKLNIITKLDLSDDVMDDDKIDQICDLLCVNTSIQILRICDFNIFSDKNSNVIAKILSSNNCLRELCINGNNISSSAIKKITDALINNTGLRVLDLFLSKIDVDGYVHLAEMLTKNKTLENLYLKNTCIKPDCVKIIAKSLISNTSLKILDLSENRIDADTIIEISNMLTKNTGLHLLDLRRNTIGCQNKNSSHLDSSFDTQTVSNELKGAFSIAKSLKINTCLRTLLLSATNLSVKEAVKIVKSKYLTELDLGSNGIGSDGAILISKILSKNNNSLHSLDLSANHIDDNGAVEIANMLKVNDKLHTLYLDSNKISSLGASDIAKSLKTNCTLEDLSLRLNIINDMSKIAKMLKVNKTLHSLDISLNRNNNFDVSVLLDCVKMNTTLRKLKIHRSDFDDTETVLKIRDHIDNNNYNFENRRFSKTKNAATVKNS